MSARKFFGGLTVLFSMSACGPSAEQIAQTMIAQTASADRAVSIGVATAIAETETAKPTPTPTVPTPTATVTPTPSYTPVPPIPAGLLTTPDPNMPVAIVTWDIGTDFDVTTFQLRRATSDFATNDKVFILIRTRVNAGAAPLYRAEWSDSNGMVWVIEQGTVSLGESVWYLSADPPKPLGWLPGPYTVKLYVDEQLALSWNFTVSH